jgi:hypothetical protein
MHRPKRLAEMLPAGAFPSPMDAPSAALTAHWQAAKKAGQLLE